MAIIRGILGGLLALGGGLVQAAVFTVNATVDQADLNPGDGACLSSSNVCTLRAAIQEANALPGPDIINIPANLNPYRLSLQGAGEDMAATGDLDIRDHLTIIGGTPQTPADTVIDAGGSTGLLDRVFHIAGSLTTPVTVEFRDLTIANGYQQNGVTGGGNICISCAINALGDGGNALAEPVRHRVTLRYVTVQGGYDYVGGAGIMNTGADLLIEDSTITGNTTPYQPASTTAANQGGGFGGGIANVGGNLTLRRSVVSNNQAQVGGGISNEDRGNNIGLVMLDNSQIDGNLAFQGGGIYNSSGNWNLVSRALTDYGVRIVQSTISNNQAEVGGGGLYNYGLGAVLISNSTISNNLAQTVFSGMNQMDGFSQVGGGIYHVGSIIDVVGSTVAGNRIGNGSGMMGGITLDGHELFVNATNAPVSGFPYWVSFQGTILGDLVSASDVCGGTTGFTDYIIDAGGNTVADTTCGVVSSAKPRAKAGVRRTAGAGDWLKLEPLANNGGLPGQALPDGTYPLTRALKPGSLAINAGENCPRIDQRGFARGLNSCDSGAYQVSVNTKGYNGEPPNQPPLARDDFFVMAADSKVLSVHVMNLLANDVDADGDVLQIDKAALDGLRTRQGGKLAIAGNQEQFLHYFPPAGFEGNDSFSYHASDGEYPVTATVNIRVTADNLPPKAGDIIIGNGVTEALRPGPGKTIAIEPQAWHAVSDPNGDSLIYELVRGPEQGRVEVSGDGFVYTANSDAQNIDSFVYRVGDGELWSGPARVLLTLQPAAGAVSAPGYRLSVEAGKLVRGRLADAAGYDPFHTYWLETGNARQGKVLWFEPISGEFIYRAGAAAASDESLEYIINTSMASSLGMVDASARGRVDIVIGAASGGNAPPQAGNMDLGVIAAGASIELQLMANDPDGDDLIFSIAEQPNYGRITLLNPATGLVRLEPQRHARVNRDWFTFKASDGLAETREVQVAFTIYHAANRPPQGQGDLAGTPGDMALVIDVLANDADADGDPLTVVLDSASTAQGGLVEVLAEGRRVRYTPPPGFSGSDSFRYRPSDGLSQGGPVTVAVSVIPPSQSPLEAAKGIETIWDSDDGTVALSPDSTAVSVSGGKGVGGAMGGLGLLILLLAGGCRRRFH